MPDQPSNVMTTAVKYEPRRTDKNRIVLRPASSSVKFLSGDGIVLTVHLPDIDLAQIGAYFVFPNVPGVSRTAGDPLSSLPSRLGQILSQSVTPLLLVTEFVAYVTATDLPNHEGPAAPLDIVAEQQAFSAMRSLAAQQADGIKRQADAAGDAYISQAQPLMQFPYVVSPRTQGAVNLNDPVFGNPPRK